MATKSHPHIVILNIPELAEARPEWNQVRAAFANQKGIIMQTMIRLLTGKMAHARKSRETNPNLPADEGKFCDGEAGAANEILLMLLQLQRGELEKMPVQLKGLFIEPESPKKS